MKALPLLLAVIFLAGCDMKKLSQVLDPSPPTPEPTPAPVAKTTPKPTPKPGEWMFTEKGALDQPGRERQPQNTKPTPGATPKPGDWIYKTKGPLDRR